MSSDMAMLSLAEASRLLKQKEVSPVELVDAVLNRIASEQEKLNAFITILHEEAKKAARVHESEILRNGQRSPLHGIPVALKDLFYTKGIRTTAGSKILAEFIPDYNSTVAERLELAGSILVGKTNTHEFAYGPSTESSYYGPTRNPWNLSKIPGGSSGGSGAAVAAGMAYMAMGTDTGGSIRIPACLCGVVGFKPTYGTVSLYGIIPLSSSFDHPGPLARSVADVALTLDIIAGHDPKDPFSAGWEKPGYFEAVSRAQSLNGLVIGVPENFFFDKVDAEVEKKVREAISHLEELGAEIRGITVPGAEDSQKVTSILMSVEATYNHRRYLTSRAQDYQPDVRARIEKGFEISAVEYYDALKRGDEIKRSVASVFAQVDLLAMPTVPVPAYDIGAATVMVKGAEQPAREMLTRHTRLANLTGGPALSLPCGLTSEGLPCGLQLMGKPFDDVTVLKAGYVFEKHYPWPNLRER